MRFYTEIHQHCCGIDLHAKTMSVCILDREGQVLHHRNLSCDAERFLRTFAPYREDLVVAVECIFTWYWLADGSAKSLIGHPLSLHLIREGPKRSPGSLPLPRAPKKQAAGHRFPHASISLFSGTA
jgi:hypothetical protein